MYLSDAVEAQGVENIIVGAVDEPTTWLQTRNKPHSPLAAVGEQRRRKCLAALPVRLSRSLENEWMGALVERVGGRVLCCCCCCC